jgi:glycosyltransferase involved in cell wall biosynthesis
MMSKPMVSIIMPAYNTDKYIESSILSVINQTFKNWELLIIDDCSTDHTMSIIQKISKSDCRIRAIFSKSNSGSPAKAKN